MQRNKKKTELVKYVPDFQYNWYQAFNFYRKADDSWRRQRFIESKTGLVTGMSWQAWDTPWDLVNPNPLDECVHYTSVYQIFSIVPEHCLNCWKVVVRPSKHSELIALRNLMRKMSEKDPRCFCKCGIEQRNYVPGLYGGYFYNRSKEAGLQRLEQVREIVTKEIDNLPVYLKRYCTEFETTLGDSAKYEQTEDKKFAYDFYMQSMKKEKEYPQCNLTKLNTYQKWIEFGWKYGTPEDRKEIEDTYHGGKPLYVPPRKYEVNDG